MFGKEFHLPTPSISSASISFPECLLLTSPSNFLSG
jgi:hypothetical protein